MHRDKELQRYIEIGVEICMGRDIDDVDINSEGGM